MHSGMKDLTECTPFVYPIHIQGTSIAGMAGRAGKVAGHASRQLNLSYHAGLRGTAGKRSSLLPHVFTTHRSTTKGRHQNFNEIPYL